MYLRHGAYTWHGSGAVACVRWCHCCCVEQQSKLGFVCCTHSSLPPMQGSIACQAYSFCTALHWYPVSVVLCSAALGAWYGKRFVHSPHHALTTVHAPAETACPARLGHAMTRPCWSFIYHCLQEGWSACPADSQAPRTAAVVGSAQHLARSSQHNACCSWHPSAQSSCPVS